jgi:hypothetical protein
LSRLTSGVPAPPEQAFKKIPPPPSVNPQQYAQNALGFVGAMAALGALSNKFTRRGGTASLSAFAGAVKGWQQGNLEAYKTKMDEWRATTEQTLDNNQTYLNKYKAILGARNVGINDQIAALKVLSAEYQDTISFEALNADNYKLAATAHDKAQKAQNDAVKSFMESNRPAEFQDQENQAKADLLRTPQGQAELAKMDPVARLPLEGLMKTYPPQGAGGAPGAQAYGHPLPPEFSPQSWQFALDEYNQTGKMPVFTYRGTSNIRSQFIADAANRAIEQGKTPQQVTTEQQLYATHRVGMNRFLSGPQGNTIRSLNVVVDHLETMRELAGALKNGNTRLFNQVAQRFAAETGQTAPTNFDTAKQIVGAEIIKALGVAGAGTQAERNEAADSFNRARSPDQIEGAIRVAQRLLTGQLRGLRQQFGPATGLPIEDFDEMLAPRTRKFFGELDTGANADAANDHAGMSDADLKAKLGIK